MRNKIKERLPKINFILGAALFLLSSFSFFGEGQVSYAILFLIIGLTNLALIRFQPGQAKWVNAVVLALNVAGAILVALDYQAKGTKGLHLAWWLISALYLLALFLQLRRKKPADTPAP